MANANEQRDWRICAEVAQALIRIARPMYASKDLGLDLDNTVVVPEHDPVQVPHQHVRIARPIHAREGVEHLWLVDPVDRTLEAFELREGEWLPIATAKDDDPVDVRPLDAVTFSLADLWP